MAVTSARSGAGGLRPTSASYDDVGEPSGDALSQVLVVFYAVVAASSDRVDVPDRAALTLRVF
jgi:hypothetical protein